MKKYVIIVIAFVVALVGFNVIRYLNLPDGTTLESRKEMVAQLPQGKGWNISVETTVSDFIISGIYSQNEKSGIAVFAPDGEKRYKLQSRTLKDQDRVVIAGAIIDNTWYDIVWFNGAQTAYAEITYTYDGKTREPIRHSSANMEIFVYPAPSDEYTLQAVYYDEAGNKYE